MNIQERRALLDSAKGKFFSVTFVKKDGTTRQMTAKKWQESAFTYGSANARPNPCAHKPEIYTACDNVKGEFRNIPLDRLLSAKVNGKEYKF